MLDFEPPILEDRKWLRPILYGNGSMASEFAFGTLFTWKDTYHTKICKYGKYVFICTNRDGITYKMPFGESEITPGLIGILVNDAKERNIPFIINGISKSSKDKLENMFPDKFSFKLNRNDCDYIYKSSDLIALPGRRYHGKRNHISQFKRKYSWEYEDINKNNIEECCIIAREWCRVHGCSDENGFESEVCALHKALKYFGELGLAGGLIKVEGKPAAFTVGEEINSKVYLMHFEKAVDGYNGIYTVINNEFASRHLSKYEYINREEDMGLEGLRRSKLSYHPSVLFEKYSAYLKASGAANG